MQLVKTDTSKMKNLKQELNQKDLEHLQRAIVRHFNENARFNRHNKMILRSRNFKQLDEQLGLAYTSTSSFAMLSICNDEIYLDEQKKYHYNCFGMNEGGFCIALCHNLETEEELYINI